MDKKWHLKETQNVNQMLRIRKDINPLDALQDYKHLLIVKHEYHIADDIMFPDPACLAFFTTFEQSHLSTVASQNKIFLAAVEIKEGLMRFFIYCDDVQKTMYDCIDFLKTNSLYSCDFQIATKDKEKIIKELIS